MTGKKTHTSFDDFWGVSNGITTPHLLKIVDCKAMLFPAGADDKDVDVTLWNMLKKGRSRSKIFKIIVKYLIQAFFYKHQHHYWGAESTVSHGNKPWQVAVSTLPVEICQCQTGHETCTIWRVQGAVLLAKSWRCSTQNPHPVQVAGSKRSRISHVVWVAYAWSLRNHSFTRRTCH